MRLRALSLLLVASAAALQLGVAGPARRDSAAAGDAYRRARDARRGATLRLEHGQRREAAWRKLTAQANADPARAGDAVTQLRRDVLDAVRATGLSAVRLAVRPARAPVGATLVLSARGTLQDASRLSDDLTAAKGLVLEQVRLTPSGSDVTLEVQGVRLLGAL